MPMTDQNLTVTQGEAFDFNIIINPLSSGQNLDLTGAQVIWEVFAGNYTGARKFLEKSLGAGTLALALTPVSGQNRWVAQVRLSPAETAGLAPANYFHQLKVVPADGETKHPTTGQFKVQVSPDP